MRQRIKDAAMPFFFADAGEQYDEPLVEVVRRDAAAASWFIELTMLFSTTGATIACTVSAVFLCMYWERCSGCDRPLRWWLLIQALLQAVQVPVRLVTLITVRTVHRAEGDLEATMKSLTASPAWFASKTSSLVLYGWFILGFVWWVHSTDCAGCAGMGVLTGGVMVLSVARAAVTLVAFTMLFPQTEQEFDTQEVPSKVEGATSRQINALALVRYPGTPSQEGWLDIGEPSCAVCISDFSTGELLRQLPCRHNFHKCCIDKWLLRNKRCPLCMSAIDDLANSTSASKARRRTSPLCN